MCLLKILESGWFFGKHLSTMWRNFFPRLVLTLQFHGGLYQVVFLCRFLLRFLLGVCMGCWLYVNLYVYPLSFRAFWYGGTASSKTFWLDEMLVSLLFIFSGMFFLCFFWDAF